VEFVFIFQLDEELGDFFFVQTCLFLYYLDEFLCGLEVLLFNHFKYDFLVGSWDVCFLLKFVASVVLCLTTYNYADDFNGYCR